MMSGARGLPASPDLTAPRLRAEISQPVFLGVVWSFVAISLVFVLVRCFIKVKTFKQISSDDIIAITAWGIYLTNVTLWTVKAPILYENYEMLQGKRPFSLTALERYGSFVNYVAVFTILFYTSLWSIKISLLLFFRRLGHQIRSHEVWWWSVIFFTVSTWLVCVADIDWACSTKPFQWVMMNCATQAKVDYQNSTFYANCALDILSDCLIISIPVLILWNTRVPLRKKVVLIGLFSATVIVMVISVVRVAAVDSKHQSAEIAWLIFWSLIENGTAIMISCVVSFRQLFIASQERTQSSPSSSKFYFLRFVTSLGASNRTSRSRNKSERSLNSESSPNGIHPLKDIRVQRVVSISSANDGRRTPTGQKGYLSIP